MPPEAQPAAEPSTKPDAPAPTAAQQSAQPPRDNSTGRFQKRKSLPSLSDRMAQLEEREKVGAKVPDVERDEPDEAEADGGEPSAADASAEPAKGEPPKRRETVDADPPAQDDQTKKAIEREITSARLKFNEYKRRQLEALESHMRTRQQEHEAQLRAAREEFEKQRAEVTPRMERAERVLKLMESADYEELAKEAGYENWEKFQGHVLGAITDPNYRETRELRRKLEEREKREQAEKEAAERRAKQEQAQAQQREYAQRQAQAIAAHKKALSEEMAKSSDRLVREMADDPRFVNSVFEIQRLNYDRSEPDPKKATVSVEKAARMALPGASRTLREELVILRDRLNKALAEDDVPAAQAAAAAITQAKADAKPKPSKTAVVPSAATVEPAPAGRFKGPRDPEWIKYRNQKLEEAAEEEEREKRAKRAARGR